MTQSVRVNNLIDVVEFEVLEEKQQQSRDGLDNDFLVAVHVNSQLHALKDCDAVGHTNNHFKKHSFVSIRLFSVENKHILISLMVMQLLCFQP